MKHLIITLAAILLGTSGCSTVNHSKNNNIPGVQYIRDGSVKAEIPAEISAPETLAVKAPDRKTRTAADLAQSVKEQDKFPARLPYCEVTSYTARFSYCPEASATCDDLFVTYVDENNNNVIDPEDKLILALHQNDPDFSVIVITDENMDSTADNAYIDFVDKDMPVPIATDAQSMAGVNQFYERVLTEPRYVLEQD